MSGQDSGYTVTKEYGCKVIRGSVPLVDMVALTNSAPKGAVMNIQLAQMLKATLVFGLPEDCDNALKALRFSTAQPEEVADSSEEQQIAEWLARGEVGLSSKTMAQHFLGKLKPDSPCSHPHDPSDFRRCALLLRRAPSLRQRLNELKALSPYWKEIVEHWDEFEALLDEEVPGWAEKQPDGSSPKLYARMQSVYETLKS